MYNFGVFFRKTMIAVAAVLVMTATAFAKEISVSAKSAILICADTGESIFEKDADTRRGMASTTKIMTALLAIENGNPDAEVQIPDAAIGVEGSSLYLRKSEKMTLRDLTYGLMLRSANDAAEAIAILLGGSVTDFAKQMNRKATEIGLTNTGFTNPHGLADDAHFTTARDLAKLSAYALQNETFLRICSAKKATLPGERLVVNHNKMLFTYDGAIGVKTGFTKATGRCLVSAAERDGVRLIAVTLDAPNDWRDHTAMLNYGFATYESVQLGKKGDFATSIPLLNGENEYTDLVIAESVTVCLPKARGSIVERIEVISPRFAPVYAGEPIGKIVYLLDGKEIASAPLCATAYTGMKQPRTTWIEKIINFFG